MKEIRMAFVWYDSDFHTSSGKTDEEALGHCYDSMVASEVVDEDEWSDNGYKSKADYLNEESGDINMQVYTWSLFMTQLGFDNMPDWKGFGNE